MCKLKTASTTPSALFALAAAVLWFISAHTKVKAGKRPNNPDGFQTANIYVGSGKNEYELVETLVWQSIWSRWAAIAAGLAALCQAVAMYAPN
jgi:hypothetical protein